MSVTEDRWRAHTGQRYCGDGRVRCQALAKGKLRRLRARANDWESDSETFWPEAQCMRAAVPGTFACRLHGGLSPAATPRTLEDMMPLDLAEKYRLIRSNPEYLSRRDEIELLQARVYQLVERLDPDLGHSTQWDLVESATRSLQQGDPTTALGTLREALQIAQDEQKSWSEIRDIMGSLKDLTNTQIKTIKEMRLMATTEEVGRLMVALQKFLMDLGDKYFGDDAAQRTRFLTDAAAGLAGLTNTQPRTTLPQLVAGSD